MVALKLTNISYTCLNNLLIWVFWIGGKFIKNVSLVIYYSRNFSIKINWTSLIRDKCQKGMSLQLVQLVYHLHLARFHLICRIDMTVANFVSTDSFVSYVWNNVYLSTTLRGMNIIDYCIVLYCIVLYRIVLYCIVLGITRYCW